MDMLGGVVLVDQQTGQQVSGFISESSRGPNFEVQECCDGAGPTTMTVQILKASQPYAVTTLHRQFKGFYTGRWDWSIPSLDPNSPVPPEPSAAYVARVITPCGAVQQDIPFTVFRGEVDVNDPTPPTVTVSISGSSTSVTTGGAPQTVTIPHSVSTRMLTATVTDPQGAKSVELFRSGPTAASNSKQAQPVAPVPELLSTTLSVPALLPNQEITAYAVGANFNPNTSLTTPTLTIRAAQVAPVLTGVDPSSTYVWTTNPNVLQTVELIGGDLFFPPLLTTIEIEAADGTMHSVTTFNQSTSNAKRLRGVVLPESLSGKGGIAKVRVTVNGVQSNWMNLELRDRPEGFNRIKLSDGSGAVGLWKPNGSAQLTEFECKGPNNQTITQATHPFAIKKVKISRKGGGTVHPTHIASFELADGTTVSARNIGFSVHPNNTVGGVRVTEDCRLAVVLSYNGPGTQQPAYTAVFSYFNAQGQDAGYNHSSASPFYLNSSGIEEGDGRYWNVLVSKDGSAAVITHANSGLQSNGSNIPVVATLVDFRTLAPLSNRWNSNGSCGTSAACLFTATLVKGRFVTVFLDHTTQSFLKRTLN
jgi:hypothetical protein